MVLRLRLLRHTYTPLPLLFLTFSLIEYGNAYAHQTILLWYGYANTVSF
jgi:hypothetical protein